MLCSMCGHYHYHRTGYEDTEPCPVDGCCPFLEMPVVVGLAEQLAVETQVEPGTWLLAVSKAFDTLGWAK